MEKHLKHLGFKVRDKVTGFVGICESISFDLYGCVQAVVRPEVDKKKATEVPEGRWFDEKRLVAISKSPVMEVPTFENVAGPCEKPYRA